MAAYTCVCRCVDSSGEGGREGERGCVEMIRKRVCSRVDINMSCNHITHTSYVCTNRTYYIHCEKKAVRTRSSPHTHRCYHDVGGDDDDEEVGQVVDQRAKRLGQHR